mmetsp:Transcript_41576/g.75992  ORF Transcript_41576/g.75992 Transcript_41576/m.75992 type:complete len:203 (-) Transcript_41576:1120-1728(-)
MVSYPTVPSSTRNASSGHDSSQPPTTIVSPCPTTRYHLIPERPSACPPPYVISSLINPYSLRTSSSYPYPSRTSFFCVTWTTWSVPSVHCLFPSSCDASCVPYPSLPSRYHRQNRSKRPNRPTHRPRRHPPRRSDASRPPRSWSSWNPRTCRHIADRAHDGTRAPPSTTRSDRQSPQWDPWPTFPIVRSTPHRQCTPRFPRR